MIHAFDWFGTTFEVRVEGEMTGLVVPPRPGLSPVGSGGGCELHVNIRPTGVDVDGEVVATASTLLSAWDQAWRHLELHVAAHSVDPVFIHAGAVGIDDRGYVIPGRSGVGKTTLVLALLRAGATYYSDEYALIDSHGVLHPYPRDPHVRSGRGGRGDPVAIQELTDSVGEAAVPVAGVLLTSFRDGARWRPGRREARDCVIGLLDNAVGARTRTPSVLDAVAAVARSAWCVEGVRGDPSEVSEWLCAAGQRSVDAE